MLQRTVEFAHLTHRLSGREVDYFNTHLCLCNGEELLGSAVTIADTIAANRRPGSRLILTGDFNCDDGWEQSKPVRSVGYKYQLKPAGASATTSSWSYSYPLVMLKLDSSEQTTIY